MHVPMDHSYKSNKKVSRNGPGGSKPKGKKKSKKRMTLMESFRSFLDFADTESLVETFGQSWDNVAEYHRYLRISKVNDKKNPYSFPEDVDTEYDLFCNDPYPKDFDSDIGSCWLMTVSGQCVDDLAVDEPMPHILANVPKKGLDAVAIARLEKDRAGCYGEYLKYQ